MKFLDIDRSTTGKDEWVITNALNSVVTSARENAQHWEMPT